MSETELAEFEAAARRQVCECAHFGDDHHPDPEDSRCKVIGCDCGEFREQPGPTRTMGITMSVETAIALQVEAGLDGRIPEEDLHDVAYDIADRVKKQVVDPVVAGLEAENARLVEKVRNSIPMAGGPESPAVSIPPSPVPRVWKKGDPE